MKLRKNTFNKFKLAIFALVLALCSALTLIYFMPHYFSKAASEYEDVTSSLTTNAHFDNRVSTSSGPSQPSNFSYGTVAKDNDDNYVHGVIDLTAADIDYENSLPEDHKYVLMLNGTENFGQMFEYKTSNTLQLTADSYYHISADVYTNNNSGIGKLVLYDGSSNKAISTLDHISTNSGWSTYNFFIKTNEFDSLSIQLSLEVDGLGVVLYDNISAYKTSAQYLKTKTDALEDKYYTIIDNRDYSAKELDLTGFAVIGGLSENNGANSSYNFISKEQDANANDGEHVSALKFENTSSTYTTFKKENFVTFKQNNIYKLSIKAKTAFTEGTATAKLIQTNLEEDEEGVDSEALTISSSTSALTNGYQTFTFYVKASSQKDAIYNLLLNLGSADTKAQGSLYITSITLTNITNSIYSNAGSSNNVKLDLTSSESSDTSKYFDNGEFNLMQIEDAKNPLPATPSSWTVNAGKLSKYGIVNTQTESFMSLDLPAFVVNPKPTENDNVLLMYNSTANTISCTSSNKSISPNIETGYAIINLDVMPILADVTITLYHSNDGSNVTLGSLTLTADDVASWQTASFAIYNPYQTLNVNLEIKMTSNRAAACFVDNVTYNYNHSTDSTITLTKDNFDALTESKTTKKIDLSNLLVADSNDDFAKSKFFVGDGDLTDGLAGIINTRTSTLSNVLPNSSVEEYQIDNFKKAKDFTNPNIIGIYAINDTFYNLTSNLGFKLDASNYYKFSIDVFTPVLTTSSDEDAGVRISLSSFNENFASIKATNDWQTYSFYINPDNSTTAYITLGLGNENVKCQGRVFFGNIKFETYADEEAFNAEAVATKTSLVLKQVKAEEENTDKEERNNSASSNKSNWFYYIPSIIFAVAILICVVGVMMRKVKWKKPVKKSKTTYDRNKTVSKQYYTRKATTLREEKLRELEKELADMTNERTKYEDEYKKDLTTMRELKIKRASATEIAKLEKDMKKNRKLSSALGLNIKKQENEIEYVKSEAYLNSLIKKLSSEKVDENALTNSNENNDLEKAKANDEKTSK